MVEILKKMGLVKAQRNDLFDGIIKAGMNPDKFNITKESIQSRYLKISIFEETQKKYSFQLSIDKAKPSVFSGSAVMIKNKKCERFNKRGSWDDILKLYNGWCSALKDEIELEEKWERLYVDVEDVEFIEIDKDEKFTPKEIEIVNKKLDQFKERVLLLEISQEAKNELVEKADDLKEHTKILSKEYWQQLFIGVIVNTVMRLSLTRESAALIWNTVKTLFSNLILLP